MRSVSKLLGPKRNIAGREKGEDLIKSRYVFLCELENLRPFPLLPFVCCGELQSSCFLLFSWLYVWVSAWLLCVLFLVAFLKFPPVLFLWLSSFFPSHFSWPSSPMLKVDSLSCQLLSPIFCSQAPGLEPLSLLAFSLEHLHACIKPCLIHLSWIVYIWKQMHLIRFVQLQLWKTF